jgi:hypothetical protein
VSLATHRARGRIGGIASGGSRAFAARERNRHAAESELPKIDHATARETIAQLLRTGLLDRWIAGIHRRADETGYKRGFLHERRQRQPASPLRPGAYGHVKATARAWMAAQAGEFTSAQVGQACGISTDAAASYTHRACRDGLLEQRSEPGTAGALGRRFYRWRTA